MGELYIESPTSPKSPRGTVTELVLPSPKNDVKVLAFQCLIGPLLGLMTFSGRWTLIYYKQNYQTQPLLPVELILTRLFPLSCPPQVHSLLVNDDFSFPHSRNLQPLRLYANVIHHLRRRRQHSPPRPHYNILLCLRSTSAHPLRS